MKLASIRKGFTLIEILIVVIILGILAAIVIPQFTNASDEARQSSTASQLQTLRSAVELFKLHHGDVYPTTDGLATTKLEWASLLTTSLSYDSKLVGPYLQQTPSNPLVGNAEALAVASDALTTTAGTAWVIKPDGRIFACDKGGTLMAK